jgi:hypothetical protein
MNVDLPSDLGAPVAARAASLDRPESWVIAREEIVAWVQV